MDEKARTVIAKYLHDMHSLIVGEAILALLPVLAPREDPRLPALIAARPIFRPAHAPSGWPMRP